MKKIGLYLQKCRIEKGLSQLEVARRSQLGGTGQHLSNIERGMCRIPLKHIKKVCRVIGADPKRISEMLVDDYRKTVRKSFR